VSESLCSEVKSNERYFISTVKSLESENAYLRKRLEQETKDKQSLAHDAMQLKTQNRLQELRIEQLMQELSTLRSLDLRRPPAYSFTPGAPSPPPSIIKSSSSSPRRNRVAFNSVLEVASYKDAKNCIFLERVEMKKAS
jgi:hypothetical protein